MLSTAKNVAYFGVWNSAFDKLTNKIIVASSKLVSFLSKNTNSHRFSFFLDRQRSVLFNLWSKKRQTNLNGLFRNQSHIIFLEISNGYFFVPNFTMNLLGANYLLCPDEIRKKSVYFSVQLKLSSIELKMI